jgi:triosephosphate isomerase
MRRLLVAGNWKMNATVAMTEHLLTTIRNAAIDTCDVAVFPPFPYLALAQSVIGDAKIALGAQTCSFEQNGAFTGEVAVSMLAEFQVAMVLVGHSERRSLYGETDNIVLLKTLRVLEQGMTAVVCIGETLEERQAAKEREVVEAQLQLLLDELSDEQWQSIVLAYEPVWAIGTGETATPEQAQAMHHYIRGLLFRRNADIANTTQILYGGSVKAANAAELFSQPDIDGGLVGGASLDANEFLGICRVQ